jgi:Tat protein secretion system quality control protein TatD with DNase activity
MFNEKTTPIVHKNNYKLFDIAANLCDEKFQGIYNGKKYHEDDTDEVIQRAHEYGVEKMLFASGSIEDLILSFKLTQKRDDFYTTIGIHPCRASVFYKLFNILLFFTIKLNLILFYNKGSCERCSIKKYFFRKIF